MADRLPIQGPYREVDVAGGGKAPFYVIPFDEDGVCTGPVTRQHLLDTLGQRSYTDVFLFSHGWNNTWPSAIKRYEDFISGFAGTRAQYPLAGPAFRPLLAGVFLAERGPVQLEERARRSPGRPLRSRRTTRGPWLRSAGDHRGRPGAPLRPAGALLRAGPAAGLQEGEARELAGLLAPLWSEDGATDDLGSSRAAAA